jgi:pilus assembly protein CpaE
MEGGVVRVVLYDASGADGGALRETVENVPGARIVEAVSDGAELESAIERTSADLVIANLDPSPDDVMATVRSAVRAYGELEYYAASSRDDAVLIKSSMRCGFSEFLNLPSETARLAEAIGGLRKRCEGDDALGRVISVLGSAGGVGCTTVAVNLAVELADKCGREVALVDLNFLYGHVAMMLDLEIQHSIADLCGEKTSLDEKVLQKAVTKHKSGLHVVPRPRDFEEAEGMTAEHCLPLIKLLRQMYPYVVLDGPNAADSTGLTILEIADWNFLVVQPLVTAARNAKRILGGLSKYGFKGQPLKVICNRAGGGLSHLNIQRLEKSLGTSIQLCVPDDWTSVSAAINLGEPLLTNAPKSKAREAIRELADTVRGDGDSGNEKGSGLFRRLLKR